MFFIFAIWGYPLLESLATNTMEKIGMFILLIVVAIVLGFVGIVLGPRKEKEKKK